MNEINIPTQSKTTLIKASVIALLVSIVVFITIILPAEYNQDPTGLGSVLGLTVLSGEAEPIPELEAKAEENSIEKTETSIDTEERIDQAEIVVSANRGVEYKFKMQKHAKITYEWSTDGTALYFDFHGEPKGDTTGYFESYTIATANEVKGSATVPFDGVHGWYWKNTTDKDVVVTLKTNGIYEVVGMPQ